MRFDNLLPDKEDRKVLELSRMLSSDSPLYVQIQPDEDFEPLCCFLNVDEKIRRAGGDIVYGWEISQIPKIHLEARSHAVWRSPAGELLDMTPEEFGQSQILFLPDARQRDNRSQAQQRRFSLARDKQLVEEYWELQDESLSMRQSVELGAISVHDSAIRARMMALYSRLKSVREALQNDA